MSERHEPAPGLLIGVKILDFGIWRPVPYATQLLADLGADVLKVEPPGGDPMRGFFELYATISSHKRSIELDLKSADGLARALELAAEADVVTEGFRPGVAERMGIGPDAIRAVNPDVVYLSLSGFGQDGPMRLAPGHDLGYQALAGTITPEGGEPVQSSMPWADLAGGLAAAFAVCAALVGRLLHGDGDVIDVAMTDVLASWTGAAAGSYSASPGKRLKRLPGYGIYRCNDGWVALSGITEQHFWTATCDALGLDDVRDLTLNEWLDRSDELVARIAAVFATLSRADALERLLAKGAPAAPVYDRAQMLADEHLRVRRTVIDGPDGRPALAHPVRYRDHPASGPAVAAELDEHRGEGFLD
jgi:crotonobetainyl-CoA:carnitine CoA-transferase CaiB-like acyl-CoA transferase